MKQKQTGSAHIILLSLIVVLISGALTYFLLKALHNTPSAEPVKTKQQSAQIVAPVAAPAEKTDAVKDQTYVEFTDWKMRFPTSTTYTLKRSSATGNGASYWISIDSLAQTCTTPDTPWLGLISQYTPSDKFEVGPDAGKSYSQVFGEQGEIINGKLYVFKVMTQFCMRNKSIPAVEQAAEMLKSEIANLEAY